MKVEPEIIQKKSDRLKQIEILNKFKAIKNKGYKVDAIAPQAAIYLTVQIDLLGMVKPDGKKIEKTEDITNYILDDAKIGLVPFSAFGSFENPTWYRFGSMVSGLHHFVRAMKTMNGLSASSGVSSRCK